MRFRVAFLILFIAAAAARADFREFKDVAKDPQIETALRHAADAALKEFPKLTSENLAISVVDVTKPTLLARGDYHGDDRFYPASVIKLFYMAETFHEKKETEKDVDRALKEMIRISDNDATAFIVDTITDTCSGPALDGRARAKFIDKRRVVNKWLAPMGYATRAMMKAAGLRGVRPRRAGPRRQQGEPQPRHRKRRGVDAALDRPRPRRLARRQRRDA